MQLMTILFGDFAAPDVPSRVIRMADVDREPSKRLSARARISIAERYSSHKARQAKKK